MRDMADLKKVYINFIAFFPIVVYNVVAGRDTLYTHDIELAFKRYVISSIMRPPLRWLLSFII